MITTGDIALAGTRRGSEGFGERETGKCKNHSCGRYAVVLLSGYCVECAAQAGAEPARRSGCAPIRLTAPAVTAPVSSSTT